MGKSEGSQHIYNCLKNGIETPFGRRIMEELGVIRGLEIDETKNYILIPMRVTKDGKEVTTGWEVKQLSKGCKVAYKLHDDEDIWLDENFKEVRGEPKSPISKECVNDMTGEQNG